MRRGILVAGILLLPLMAPGCSDKPVGNQAGTRQFEEDCDAVHECISGLICEGGKCRQVCTSDTANVCPDGYSCLDDRCVKNSINNGNNNHTGDGNSDSNNHGNDGHGNNNQGQTEGSKIALPAGGGLTNVAGKTNGSRYKVEVLGGSIAGSAKGTNNSVQINEGSWK